MVACRNGRVSEWRHVRLSWIQLMLDYLIIYQAQFITKGTILSRHSHTISQPSEQLYFLYIFEQLAFDFFWNYTFGECLIATILIVCIHLLVIYVWQRRARVWFKRALRDMLYFQIQIYRTLNTIILQICYFFSNFPHRHEGSIIQIFKCSHTNLQCLKDMATGLLFQFRYCYQQHRLQGNFSYTVIQHVQPPTLALNTKCMNQHNKL